jgi:hypothetical protein
MTPAVSPRLPCSPCPATEYLVKFLRNLPNLNRCHSAIVALQRYDTVP